MKNRKNDFVVIESKISELCRKKGWDVKNLTTDQMLIVSRFIIDRKIKYKI
jgi:hypothetical protein